MKYCALFRETWFDSARKHMTDLERLAFYECCFSYEFTGEVPTASTCKYPSVLMMFDMVKEDLKNDREKAERIAQRNQNNGRLGGRPAKVYETLPTNENPEKPSETQQNPMGYSGLPLHYTKQHNTTMQQAASGGSGVLDVQFFDAQIWPRINAGGKFNTRHRKCVEMWQSFSDLKRQAIMKAVLSDIFAGCSNPYFYLEDFGDPEPRYLSGRECADLWAAGKSVFVVKTPNGSFKNVAAEDVQTFSLEVVKEMLPET